MARRSRKARRRREIKKSLAYIAVGAVFVALASGAKNSVEASQEVRTSSTVTPIHIITADGTSAYEIATIMEEPVNAIPSELLEQMSVAQTERRGNSLISEREIVMVAKGVYGEARGVESVTEQAAVIWTYFNRADAWEMSVSEVILQPSQFCYDESFPTVDDFGRDLTELAQDVADRWEREHNGESSVGRVLPASYLWFGGDGEHNHFRNAYRFSEAQIWNWSLPSPYES